MEWNRSEELFHTKGIRLLIDLIDRIDLIDLIDLINLIISYKIPVVFLLLVFFYNQHPSCPDKFIFDRKSYRSTTSK